ncbi:hypothetical protein [Saccharomonospora saliphila]|uniref:hypothetical protein n=1 Tax=Saccharomonospora saliphila TaxID=369829 RepID=UPI0012F85E03|nr:hypothetical protein [Saccharomonospora saliphila]
MAEDTGAPTGDAAAGRVAVAAGSVAANAAGDAAAGDVAAGDAAVGHAAVGHAAVGHAAVGYAAAAPGAADLAADTAEAAAVDDLVADLRALRNCLATGAAVVDPALDDLRETAEPPAWEVEFAARFREWAAANEH